MAPGKGSPAAVAWDPYEPAIYPDNSIHLAADIVNLTPTVVDPRPAPVAVVPAEPVVTTPFVTVPAEVPVTVETTLPVTVPVATTMPATVAAMLRRKGGVDLAERKLIRKNQILQ